MKHSSRETGSHSVVLGLQVLLAIPLGIRGPSPQGNEAVVPTSTSGQKYVLSGNTVISASQNPTAIYSKKQTFKVILIRHLIFTRSPEMTSELLINSDRPETALITPFNPISAS